MILCAGNNETFDFATPIGVGLIDSAMSLTRICLTDKPEFILFIGSAGSYGAHNIHDIIESKTAANIELGFLDKSAYTPIDNVISAQTEDIKDVIVNSSNYITTSRSAMEKMSALDIGVENMEFFAVMRVAQVFGIPAGGVFCVTNFCDDHAHQDFIANHGFAKVLLKAHLEEKGILRG